MIQPRLPAALAVVVAMSASQACAVTLEFSGAFGAGDPFFANQTFTGTFSYDANALNTGNQVQASYDQAVTGFSFSLSGGDSGSLLPAAAPAFRVFVDDFNPGDPAPNFDRWVISALGSDLSTTLSNVFFAAVVLVDEDQTAQDGIPLSGVPLPNLPELEGKSFLLQFETGFSSGTISSISIVPLPAGAVLLLSALGAVAATARRRREAG